MKVDGLEVLFHLRVLFLEEITAFLFSFLVIFINEIIELNAL